ncbi:hypothetical protein VITU102760_24140 [Vibrio tubiashii]|uniref:Uncharacterized protein n=1 Tax=Vibrio tubiashii ATCC 19109 TaxID=1051646 RepID=F9T572_9VIBR|nr:hypothetical protein [Vibrio tubiashii]AIW17425.1 hypothetical protein IX91_25550 [Vibrio tubiashii ATCC 19109]EGU55269.1 hypothetical protein VITU9109_21024 [Vibrio tubiashii ATCC 19109]EIF04449.1 hypothetical protein VT1337_08781 [Vibrio tubiashii NCIMB 1337 = ATCC 19106]
MKTPFSAKRLLRLQESINIILKTLAYLFLGIISVWVMLIMDALGAIPAASQQTIDWGQLNQISRQSAQSSVEIVITLGLIYVVGNAVLMFSIRKAPTS